MIKRFVILRRKSGMTVEEFRHYWRNVHGPLIAKIPGVKKYVQYHVHSEISDEEEQSIDGLAELWFDSKEAQKLAWQSKEYEAVVKDEPNLFRMDAKHIHPVMTDEIIHIV